MEVISHLNKPFDDEELRKLPKWASDRIAVLQMRLSEAREHIKQISNGHPGSRVVIHDFVNPERTIHPNSKIRFTFPVRPAGTDTIDVRLSNNRLEINAGGPVIVEPHASNMIYVGLR